jgi:hypothetical protein
MFKEPPGISTRTAQVREKEGTERKKERKKTEFAVVTEQHTYY